MTRQIPANPKIAELTALAKRMTYHRARAEAMGFEFKHITVDPSNGDLVQLRCVFSCICGLREEFINVFPTSMPDSLLREFTDVAGSLSRHGSFSRAHLVADGYTLEQVEEIEAKGKAFDDECRAALTGVSA